MVAHLTFGQKEDYRATGPVADGSSSATKFEKIRANTPMLDQRANLLYKVLCGPWRVDAFELSFSEPKIIRHGQVLLPTLKRKIEPKGEITMRKVFAINYVTHDGVMQSPGAFQ